MEGFWSSSLENSFITQFEAATVKDSGSYLLRIHLLKIMPLYLAIIKERSFKTKFIKLNGRIINKTTALVYGKIDKYYWFFSWIKGSIYVFSLVYAVQGQFLVSFARCTWINFPNKESQFPMLANWAAATSTIRKH